MLCPCREIARAETVFVNQQIDTRNLPNAETIAMQPMAPTYVREVMTQWSLFLIPVVLAAVVIWLLPLQPEPLKIALRSLSGFALVLLLALGLLVYKQARIRGWALREHDVAYRSGLVFRKTVILPFNRVQHAEVASGPLQRHFGLASVKFYTAGGSSVDLKITGLESDRANDLRDHILARAEKTDAG